MLYMIALFALCFFGAIGFVYTFVEIINIFVCKKVNCQSFILIDGSTSSEETEYAIRNIESLILRDNLYPFIKGIKLTEDTVISDEIFIRLSMEYNNIYKV